MGTPFPVSLALISHKRFTADCSYNADVIGVFKTIPSKQYNPLPKTWNFDVKDYAKLVSSLHSLRSNLKLQEIPPRVLEVVRDVNSGPGCKSQLQVDLSVIGPLLHDNLMPFQRKGVMFGIQQAGKVLIADDMGLGKTLQGLAIASFYKTEWPLLIICPSSVRMTWSQAILRWLPTVNENDINIVLKGTDDPTQGMINILSYDLLTKLRDKVRQKQIQVVIADESHYLKNSKAARTKAIVPILKSARRVILLSGTPALSRPEELFMQINAINSKLYPHFVQFAYRYCNAKKTPFGLDTSGSSNLGELKIVLEHKIMIRRLKTDVMSQLPEKLRQVVTLDPSLVNIKRLEDQRRKVTNASKKERHGALLEYFHATGAAKVKAVSEYVQDMIEKKNKFLLFAHHQIMLDAMVDVLERKHVSYIRIDGSISSKDRHRYVEMFQEDGNCQVAVLSILAANVGLTLTAATFVVFAELYWNPGALVQAEDRAFRIGQKNAVTIIYLMAKKTADDYVWPLVQEKLQVLANAGLTQGNQLDAEITSFQDPKQKQILDFFQEFAMDNDDGFQQELERISPKKTVVDGPVESDRKTSPQKTLNQYFTASCKGSTSVSRLPIPNSNPATNQFESINKAEIPSSNISCAADDDILEMDDGFDEILLAVDDCPPAKKTKY